MPIQFTAELTAVKCQFSDQKSCNIFLIFVLNLDCGYKWKLQLARVLNGYPKSCLGAKKQQK